MKWKSYYIFVIIGIVTIGAIVGKYLYQAPKFINGEMAQDFSGTLIDGTPFKLSNLRGRYVLLDFWGSWCGPCRKANHELVPLYKKFHTAQFQNADGFEVVSVGVEKNIGSWKKAIEQDELTWKYHISSMEYFDNPVVKQYGVKEIPTSYLIDEKGMIIGVNLLAENMDRMFSDRLKK